MRTVLGLGVICLALRVGIRVGFLRNVPSRYASSIVGSLILKMETL